MKAYTLTTKAPCGHKANLAYEYGIVIVFAENSHEAQKVFDYCFGVLATNGVTTVCKEAKRSDFAEDQPFTLIDARKFMEVIK